MLLEASGGLKLRESRWSIPGQAGDLTNGRSSVERRLESVPGRALTIGITRKACQCAWPPYFLFNLGKDCDDRAKIVSRGLMEVDI